MEYRCCNKCYKKVARVDLDAAILWPQLCSTACFNDGIVQIRLKNSIDEELEVLERMGFITTRETLERIDVRVNGAIEDDEEEEEAAIFCLDEWGHGRR